MAELVLKLQNISKRFGNLEILDDLNLEAREGQSLAILGPSGAGKSTLLHIAGLMEEPSLGTVFIRGVQANRLNEKERAAHRLKTIGFVFQFHHLLPDFNVLENILIPCRLAKDDLTVSTKEARELADKLGLSDRLTHRPQQLSGGEQQRVAFARAMIRKPSLLLCDEPTGNLDQHTAGEMMDLLWNEIKERRLTTILVTHNEALAKRTNVSYHLSDGRLSDGKLEGNQSVR